MAPHSACVADALWTRLWRFGRRGVNCPWYTCQTLPCRSDMAHLGVDCKATLKKPLSQRTKIVIETAGQVRWGLDIAPLLDRANTQMPGRDIIVMGASAGGITAFRTLLPLLPGDLPAALFLVLHRRSIASEAKTILDILTQNLELQAEMAEDGLRFSRGRVYVAPSDSHVLLERGVIRVEHSPAENHCRPSADVLFRSAAKCYGCRVIGVVLTGMLRDGTAGLWQIWKHGGATIVQDPREASFPDMPKSALANVPVDYCLPLAEIAEKLISLATEPTSISLIDRSATAFKRRGGKLVEI